MPLHADNRNRSLEDAGGRTSMEYQIPGRATLDPPISRRKHVSNPRATSLAPSVVVSIVSPKLSVSAPGHSSLRGAVIVGADDLVGMTADGELLGNSVIFVATTVGTNVSLMAAVGVTVMLSIGARVGDVVMFVGEKVEDSTAEVGCCEGGKVVSVVGAPVGGNIDETSDGCSVCIADASKVGISVTEPSVEGSIVVVTTTVGASLGIAVVGKSVDTVVGLLVIVRLEVVASVGVWVVAFVGDSVNTSVWAKVGASVGSLVKGICVWDGAGVGETRA